MQFAALRELEAEWRDAGIGYDRLEVWAVGYAGQEERVTDMAGDGTNSIMIDTVPHDSAIAIYEAHVNDCVIIDAEGHLAARYNMGVNQITIEANREAFNDIVMTVLGD